MESNNTRKNKRDAILQLFKTAVAERIFLGVQDLYDLTIDPSRYDICSNLLMENILLSLQVQIMIGGLGDVQTILSSITNPKDRLNISVEVLNLAFYAAKDSKIFILIVDNIKLNIRPEHLEEDQRSTLIQSIKTILNNPTSPAKKKAPAELIVHLTKIPELIEAINYPPAVQRRFHLKLYLHLNDFQNFESTWNLLAESKNSLTEQEKNDLADFIFHLNQYVKVKKIEIIELNMFLERKRWLQASKFYDRLSRGKNMHFSLAVFADSFAFWSPNARLIFFVAAIFMPQALCLYFLAPASLLVPLAMTSFALSHSLFEGLRPTSVKKKDDDFFVLESGTWGKVANQFMHYLMMAASAAVFAVAVTTGLSMLSTLFPASSLIATLLPSARLFLGVVPTPLASMPSMSVFTSLPLTEAAVAVSEATTAYYHAVGSRPGING